MGAGLRIAKKCLPGISQVDVRKQKISAEAKARAANPYRQWNQTLHGNDHVSDNKSKNRKMNLYVMMKAQKDIP